MEIIKEYNEFEKRKIEGYWWSKYEPQYSKPVPNVLTEEEAKEIYNLIKEKEKSARKIGYKGRSHSRITGERLGGNEYRTMEWIWPADFAKHYVLDHRVKPTDDFLKYIGYNKK